MGKRTRILLQLLSLVLFVGIIWWAGPERWQGVLEANWHILWPGFLLHAIASLLSGLRLRHVAEAMNGRPLASRRRFYQLNMAARALGIVLPRSVSTLGGKSAGLTGMGVGLRRALWTVFSDNILDLLLLGSWVLPAILYITGQISNYLFLLGIMLATIILLAVLYYLPDAAWLTRFWLRLVGMPLLSRWRDKLPDDPTVLLLPRLAMTPALLLTLVLNSMLALNFYFISQAVGLILPPYFFLASFAIVQLSLVVSVLPGGIGVFDGGWLGLLHLYGVAPEEALTFVLAQRAYIWLFVLSSYAVSTLVAWTERQDG